MHTNKVLKSGHYYGEFIKRHDLSGIILTDVIYPSGHRTPGHTHERAYFSLVLQGLNDVIRTTRSSYQPSPLMYHPVGAIHPAQVRQGSSRPFFIEIESRLLERVDDQLKLKSESVALRGGATNKLAAKLYHEFHRMDHESPLAIEGLVLEMMAACSRDATRAKTRGIPRWLSQARDIIHEHYGERLSLSEIARLAEVHPVHLATEFRRFYHCTVGDYTRQLRVEAARRQLIASQRSLVEIAAYLGFAHQAHFSRTFKEYTGFTPSKFRKQFGRLNSRQNLSFVKDRKAKA